MDDLKSNLSAMWKEVSREARTSLGRRLSATTGGSSSTPAKIGRAPPGAHSLVVQEEDSGWDVIERKATPPPMRQPERVRTVRFFSR